MTVIELQCLAARAFVLSRLGRHAEALPLAREQLAMAERMDSAAIAARARHDAGLISLAAGCWAEAADLLEQALAEGAAGSRAGSPGARRRRRLRGQLRRPRPPADRRPGRAGLGTAPADRRAGWPRRRRHGGVVMPGFALSADCRAPVEEVWKLLFDPSRFPE